MATLTDDVKTAIVQALACYDTPSQVVERVKNEFGLDVARQQVESYDPNKKTSHGLAKKWRDIFTATREAFLKEVGSVGIAHRAVRLRRLDRMSNKAEDRGNMALAAQLIEQAAKEVGDSYTNRVKNEHTGKNGGPIETVQAIPDSELAKRIAGALLAK
jgi:hypothetical protein